MDADRRFTVWITSKCYVFVISLAFYSPYRQSLLAMNLTQSTVHCTLHYFQEPIIFHDFLVFLSSSSFTLSFLHVKKMPFYYDYYLKILAIWCAIFQQTIQLGRNDCCLFVWLHFVFGFCGCGPFYWHLRNNGHFSALGILRQDMYSDDHAAYDSVILIKCYHSFDSVCGHSKWIHKRFDVHLYCFEF